jgi:hypothetical protein
MRVIESFLNRKTLVILSVAKNPHLSLLLLLPVLFNPATTNGCPSFAFLRRVESKPSASQKAFIQPSMVNTERDDVISTGAQRSGENPLLNLNLQD